MSHRHEHPSVAADATGTASPELVALAEAMGAFSLRAAHDGGRPPLDELVRATADQVPGATWASITVLRADRFRTVASTSEAATHADLLQYDLRSGPCVDSVLEDHVNCTGDVTRDGRWQEWGRAAHEQTGVTSALAFRLMLLDGSGAIAGLNVYSDVRDAFDETSVCTALVLATHGSLLVTALLARDRADNLRRALESNREIGVAMGILMQRHHLTREQAFDVLRVASQYGNRKLSDIATEVADTGILAIRRCPTSPSAAVTVDVEAQTGAATPLSRLSPLESPWERAGLRVDRDG